MLIKLRFGMSILNSDIAYEGTESGFIPEVARYYRDVVGGSEAYNASTLSSSVSSDENITDEFSGKRIPSNFTSVIVLQKTANSENEACPLCYTMSFQGSLEWFCATDIVDFQYHYYTNPIFVS